MRMLPSIPQENFDIDRFMPLLRERVYVVNPFSRQFIVGWIATLDSVPDIGMLLGGCLLAPVCCLGCGGCTGLVQGGEP